jgi:3-oxoadipate enol-lactonase
MASLAFAERGEREMPGLVLLHGLGMGHRMWQPQLDAFGTRFHVLAPDLPGLAQSNTAGPFTIDGAAVAVAALVDEHHGRPAHICGLSLGGIVGLEMAIQHPAIVESLVVSGAQARPHRLLVAVQIAVMRLVPTHRLVSSMASSIPVGRPETADAAREDLGATGKRRLLDAIRKAGNVDLRPSLPRIHRRTLVLCGARDRFNLTASRMIAASIPNATLRIVSGVGHVWNLEAPDLFNETLWDFL